MSLGRRDGLVQAVHGDDSPARSMVTGRAAARIKEYICRGASWAARTGLVNPRLLAPGAATATAADLTAARVA